MSERTLPTKKKQAEALSGVMIVNLPKSSKSAPASKKSSPRPQARKKNRKLFEEDSSSEESDSASRRSPKKTNKAPLMNYTSLIDCVYAGPTFNNAPAPSSLPLPPVFHARDSHLLPAVYDTEKTNLALFEIQQNIRSMLKIGY